MNLSAVLSAMLTKSHETSPLSPTFHFHIIVPPHVTAVSSLRFCAFPQPAQMAKIRKDYKDNPDFDPSKVANASSAAEGLCKWVLAMEIYDRVAKVVAPKKERLVQAQGELAETMQQLNEKRSTLHEVEVRLANLKKQFQEATGQKEKLEFSVSDTRAASRLAQGDMCYCATNSDRQPTQPTRQAARHMTVIALPASQSGIQTASQPANQLDIQQPVSRAFRQPAN